MVNKLILIKIILITITKVYNNVITNKNKKENTLNDEKEKISKTNNNVNINQNNIITDLEKQENNIKLKDNKKEK